MHILDLHLQEDNDQLGCYTQFNSGITHHSIGVLHVIQFGCYTSFPRKRESHYNKRNSMELPAFAGMTASFELCRKHSLFIDPRTVFTFSK